MSGPQDASGTETDGQEDLDLLREQLYFQARRQRRDLRRLPALLLASVKLVWRTNRTATAAAVVLQLSGALVASLQVILAGYAVNQLVGNDGNVTSSLLLPLVVLAVVTLVGGLATSAGSLMGRLLSVQVERHVTDDVLDVTTRVDLVEFDDPVFYNQLSRVLSNVPLQPYQVVTSMSAFVGGLAGVIVLVFTLVALSPLLALIVLASGPLLWWLARRSGAAEFEFAVAQTINVREREYLQDLLTRRENAAEARAYMTASTLRGRFNELYDSFITASAALIRRRYALSFASAFATAVAASSAMLVLYFLVRDDAMTVGHAASGLLAIRLLSTRLGLLSSGAATLFQSSLFLDDFDAFLTQRSRPDDGGLQNERAEQTAASGDAVASVEQLADVCFSYPGSGDAALENVTLDIPPGQVVALVGENGSGKTTLAKLIAGLYQPTAGRLTWRTSAGEELSSSLARREITLVLQDFARYQFTVRDNVGLGRPERPTEDQAVRMAAIDAGIADIVDALPLGYETRLSRQFEGGRDLSVGQWQRLALARAFYRDGSLVVLDEPAASLDPRAERRLYDSVRKLLRGRTVILITHRMQSVRGADRIIVLDSGRVVEDGNHESLVEGGGLYAELVALQEGGGLHGSGPTSDQS